MLLKKGSNGEEVKKLQKFLGINDDGDFGGNTETAVKKWQKENGLKDDGIIGDDTWGKMFGKPSQETTSVAPGFDINKLKGQIPENVLNEIPAVMDKFKINNALRLSHFLAQCAHESGNFRVSMENLNYSVDGLMGVFGRYFPTKQLAEQYARKPELIASKVYGSRMGNGDEKTKDGYKFRGRGYIQLTGKDNYKQFDNFVDDNIMENPDLVSTKYPLLSAAWFFSKNCLSKSDKGATKEVVKEVTRCVNGGFNGLEEREKNFFKFYKLLS